MEFIFRRCFIAALILLELELELELELGLELELELELDEANRAVCLLLFIALSKWLVIQSTFIDWCSLLCVLCNTLVWFAYWIRKNE